MARATAPSRRPPSAMPAAPPPPSARSVRSHPKGVRGHSYSRPAPAPKRRAACACSPTTHPGSFRCALHRGRHGGPTGAAAPPPGMPVSSALSAPRRASMRNPLVRIAAVEGADHIRRALAALVRPTPSQRRRADAFRPRPSRLSAASSAADGGEA